MRNKFGRDWYSKDFEPEDEIIEDSCSYDLFDSPAAKKRIKADRLNKSVYNEKKCNKNLPDSGCDEDFRCTHSPIVGKDADDLTT